NVSENLQSENISSADASYIIRTPKLKARITGFYSTIKDGTKTSFFFAEGLSGDGDDNTFVAETVTGVDKRNMGIELGFEYQVTSTIKLTAAGNYAEYIYTNNPNVTLNDDDLADELNTIPLRDFGVSSLKNYRIAGTPQQAYSLGIEYRDPRFWWVGVNGNYLADNYLDISPLLRTENFAIDPESNLGLPFEDYDEQTARMLLKQEKLPDFYLLNLTGGKSWRISEKTFGFFASVNNVLDTRYKTGGFEQSRNANYQQLYRDATNGVRPFGPKYFYGYGRTFFVNLYIQF
ncbi:MAG TPA: hypothetical protein VEW65_02150, partial [Chryseolinea sp.]|nr:hypothetical protein [Chryseolinea sp.]